MERYAIDAFDFKTLHLAANTGINMRAPINGLSQVLLYIGGQLVQPNDPSYGYTITPDTNRIQTADRFYKIQFNRPVRFYTLLIEVCYTTTKNFCLKCGTTGQLYDFSPASNGSLLHVVGTPKLVQKVLKFLLTSKCPFYPQFTSKLRTFVGKKFGFTVTDADISNEVVNALQNIKQVQSAQRTVQALDPLEILKDVNNLQTTPINPTSVAVSGVLTSYGSITGTPVSFTLSSSHQLVGN